MTQPYVPVYCSEKDCTEEHGDKYFEVILAHKAGWFSTKDGRNYCPRHVPTWVAEWRQNKQRWDKSKRGEA